MPRFGRVSISCRRRSAAGDSGCNCNADSTLSDAFALAAGRPGPPPAASELTAMLPGTREEPGSPPPDEAPAFEAALHRLPGPDGASGRRRLLAILGTAATVGAIAVAAAIWSSSLVPSGRESWVAARPDTVGPRGGALTAASDAPAASLDSSRETTGLASPTPSAGDPTWTPQERPRGPPRHGRPARAPPVRASAHHPPPVLRPLPTPTLQRRNRWRRAPRRPGRMSRGCWPKPRRRRRPAISMARSPADSGPNRSPIPEQIDH